MKLILSILISLNVMASNLTFIDLQNALNRFDSIQCISDAEFFWHGDQGKKTLIFAKIKKVKGLKNTFRVVGMKSKWTSSNCSIVK